MADDDLVMIDKETKEKLELVDLIPETAELKINDITYILKKYSLRAKTYFIQKYGVDELVKQMISNSAEIVYSEIAYYLIDEAGKKDFPNIEKFQENIITPQEQLDMMEAVKKTMGHSKLSYCTETEYAEFLKEKKTMK